MKKDMRGSGSKENVGRKPNEKKGFTVRCLPEHIEQVRKLADRLYIESIEVNLNNKQLKK
jgi:hypothetical protein